MTQRSLYLLTVALLLAALALPALAQPRIPPTTRLDTTLLQRTALSVQQLNKQASSLVGKRVLLEGFYYDGSVPLVVDDIKRTLVDMVMPPESYVLVEKTPEGVRSGDKVQIEAEVKLDAQSKPTITPVSKASVLSPTTLQLATGAAQVQLSSRLRELIAGGILAMKTKHAVLIVGGYNAPNNHMRYWNDLKTMYAILRSKGYDAANIHVIYADGVAKDASTPVHFSATKANVNAVFNTLASRVKSTDTVFIWTNDHGGQSGDTAPSDEADGIDETLCLWNSTVMTDDEFAAAVDKITNYQQMIIQMKQCFCGGFVKELTKPKRVIIASCLEPQVSYGHSSNQFGEFTYHWFAALMGNKPDGSGSVNADTNSDGKISMVEAYNYARSRDAAPETPNFEDDGVVPSHMGAMPVGSEGAVGLNTFL